MDQKNNVGDGKNNADGGNAADKKKPHIKKPLNAFMLYMKEMRAKVVAECTLKESAAINQILGRRVRISMVTYLSNTNFYLNTNCQLSLILKQHKALYLHFFIWLQ